MTVSIIGSGRVGVCLGAVIARSGQSVWMTDKDLSRKQIFNNAQPPFYEPKLSAYLSTDKSRLKWTRQVDLIVSSQIIFFCLSLACQKTGELDLTELLEWVKLTLEGSTEEKILVIKSTCPLGTYKKIEEIIKGKGKKISAVICPEFLREGQAIQDLSYPERIVIGSKDISAGKKLEAFYKTFCQTKEIIHSNPETAELSKLACNSFLAVKISFINEWAGLCEKIGGDIQKLRMILGSDSRIGCDCLIPGLGYGGYCLPKDVKLAIASAHKKSYKMRLLQNTQKINDGLTGIFFKKIKGHYKKLKGVSLAFWGISFKKNTDNTRNSPALHLLYRLLKAGVSLHVYDPLFIKENVAKIFENQKNKDFKSKELDYLVKKIFAGKVFFYKSAVESLKGRQGLVVAGDSDEFKSVSLETIKNKLSSAFLVDGRSLYSKKELKDKGFSFYQRG